MNSTLSRISPKKALPAVNGHRFDPEEIRRLVDLGKERGLIVPAGTAVAIDKSGGVEAAVERGLRSVWMDVDPATSRRWLENNFRNRPLKEDTVIAYARDMMAGVWVPTHQGIAFNDRDELIDGQHRLHAIVRSETTVRMMVTFGMPSKIEGREMTTMDAVDRGRTRSVADQLTIQHGFKNGSITASICAGLANLCSGERTRRLTVGQTLEIFRAFEEPILWVIERRSREHGLRTAGVLVGFAFAAASQWGREDIDPSRAVRPMFDRLNSGAGLAEGTAMAHLRCFLMGDEAKLLSRSMDRGLAELVLEAIRLQQEGWSGDRLLPGTTGTDQFRFEQRERLDKIVAMFKLPAPLLK